MLKCKRLDPSAILPTCAHPSEDLAYDLYSLGDVTLPSGILTKVRTGIAMQHLSGSDRYGFLLRDRSSMASKGIMVSGGVIDSSYTGEIIVLLTNFSTQDINLKSGDKIVQAIPIKVHTHGEIVEVSELQGSRGEKGFGSTGK